MTNLTKRHIKTLTLLLSFFAVQTALPLFIYAQSNSTPEDSTKQDVDAVGILSGNTEQQKVWTLRKFQFLDSASASISSATDETSLDFKIESNPNISLFLSEKELQEITPVGPDPLGDELRRRYSDVPPTVPLNQALKSLVDLLKSPEKEPPAQKLLVPTDLEIDILKHLWTRMAATPSDVYASLDTSWRLTSEELHDVLEQMTQRGFLARKKVSPSNEFSLFGLAQIEMSSKNRKNEVYVYWPIIQKNKLVTYLDAQRYLAYSAAKEYASNGVRNDYYTFLEEKLMRLLQ